MKRIIAVLAISVFTLAMAQETPKKSCCAAKDKKNAALKKKKNALLKTKKTVKLKPTKTKNLVVLLKKKKQLSKNKIPKCSGFFMHFGEYIWLILCLNLSKQFWHLHFCKDANQHRRFLPKYLQY